MTAIDIPTDEIVTFCRRHRIRELALFGSVLRPDFTPESDVDVLIDFEPGVEDSLTLFDLVGMQLELSDLLHRDVDLVMRDTLKSLLKDAVLSNTRSSMRSEEQYLTDMVEVVDAIARFLAGIESSESSQTKH